MFPWVTMVVLIHKILTRRWTVPQMGVNGFLTSVTASFKATSVPCSASASTGIIQFSGYFGKRKMLKFVIFILFKIPLVADCRLWWHGLAFVPRHCPLVMPNFNWHFCCQEQMILLWIDLRQLWNSSKNPQSKENVPFFLPKGAETLSDLVKFSYQQSWAFAAGQLSSYGWHSAG